MLCSQRNGPRVVELNAAVLIMLVLHPLYTSSLVGSQGEFRAPCHGYWTQVAYHSKVTYTPNGKDIQYMLAFLQSKHARSAVIFDVMVLQDNLFRNEPYNEY